MVSILVMSVAVYILTSTVAASVTHSSAKAERSVAVEAAMNALENIRSMPQEDVFRMFNSDPTDDPYGAGTAAGPTFDVVGLDPQINGGGAPIPIGRVLVPENARGELVETDDLPAFGFPRDVNGNLGIEPGNRADDYLVLPITIRIQWQGRMGPRTFELSTMLVDLAKWQN